MTKSVLLALVCICFLAGFVWSSLVLSLIIAFRYATYGLPFIVLTCALLLYDVSTYSYLAYAALTCILIVFVYTRSHFRFSV